MGIHTPETPTLKYEEIAKLMTPPKVTKQFLKEVYKGSTTAAQRTEQIVEHHPKVFEGIGKHQYRQVKLPIDPLVQLKIQPRRKIPFAKRDKLKKLLRELEDSDVIKHVEGPTDCISNLVLTPKGNPEEILMNIDITFANKAIL